MDHDLGLCGEIGVFDTRGCRMEDSGEVVEVGRGTSWEEEAGGNLVSDRDDRQWDSS